MTNNKIMALIPFEHIILNTNLSEKEVYFKLNDFIEQNKSHKIRLYATSSSKKYFGQIEGNSFYIKRIINHKNNFLPKIEGTINSKINGVAIDIKMRLSPIVMMFLIIWSIVLILGFLFGLDYLRETKEFNIAIFWPIVLILTAYLSITIIFKKESYKSHLDLEVLFCEAVNKSET